MTLFVDEAETPSHLSTQSSRSCLDPESCTSKIHGFGSDLAFELCVRRTDCYAQSTLVHLMSQYFFSRLAVLHHESP